MELAVGRFCVCMVLFTVFLTVDSSYNPYDYNLNLQKFEFFKYPAAAKRPPTNDVSMAQKALLVVAYFRNLLAGHPVQDNSYYIPFDPHGGLALRVGYQRQFGYRGENLIALVGKGYSLQALRYYGAIGKDFGRH